MACFFEFEKLYKKISRLAGITVAEQRSAAGKEPALFFQNRCSGNGFLQGSCCTY